MQNQQNRYSDVCVVVPVFNRADKAFRAVKSVLRQTTPPREIIIVDDGSEESEKEKIKHLLSRIDDSSIEYYDLDVNAGAQAARQFGFARCTSTYVAFLDCDDWWAEDHLELLVQSMESGSFALCASNIAVFDGRKETPLRARRSVINLSDLFYDNHIGSFSCALIKSSALQAAGGLYTCPSSQDWSTWIDLATQGLLLKTSKTTCFYDDVIDSQRISLNFEKVIAGHTTVSEKIRIIANKTNVGDTGRMIKAHLDVLLLRRLHFARAPRSLIIRVAFGQVPNFKIDNFHIYMRCYIRVFLFPRKVPSWAHSMRDFIRID
jgi:glycosyltransferase involved in cell wall biosynthesis